MTEIIDLVSRNKKERELEFRPNDDMAPVEHGLIGSGVNVSGELTTLLNIARLIAEGKLSDEFLIPFSQTESPDKRLELNSRRRKKGYLKGSLPFISLDSLVYTMTDGKEICMSLPDVDDQGRIIPKWNIFLHDITTKAIIDDSSMLGKLSLAPEMAEAFQLSPDEKGKLVLSIKP